MFAQMLGGGTGGAAGAGGAAGGMNPMTAMMLQMAMQGMSDPKREPVPGMQAPLSPRGNQISLKGTKEEEKVNAGGAPSLAQLVFGGL